MLLFMCDFQSEKFIGIDECGRLELGVGLGNNCQEAWGEVLWADGNVLKLDCDGGHTTL